MCMQTPRQRPPKLSRALLCALDVLFARSQFRILFSQDLLCCGYVASFSDKIRYVFLFTSMAFFIAASCFTSPKDREGKLSLAGYLTIAIDLGSIVVPRILL